MLMMRFGEIGTDAAMPLQCLLSIDQLQIFKCNLFWAMAVMLTANIILNMYYYLFTNFACKSTIFF